MRLERFPLAQYFPCRPHWFDVGFVESNTRDRIPALHTWYGLTLEQRIWTATLCNVLPLKGLCTESERLRTPDHWMKRTCMRFLRWFCPQSVPLGWVRQASEGSSTRRRLRWCFRHVLLPMHSLGSVKHIFPTWFPPINPILGRGVNPAVQYPRDRCNLTSRVCGQKQWAPANMDFTAAHTKRRGATLN